MILEAKTIEIKGKEARFYELNKGGISACFYPANGFSGYCHQLVILKTRERTYENY